MAKNTATVGPSGRWGWLAWRGVGLAIGVTLGGAGCSLDGLLKSDEVPPGITDPAATGTPAGARAVYYGTVALFQRAFGRNSSADGQHSFVALAGLLSDELRLGREMGGSSLSPADLRALPNGYDRQEEPAAYGFLQQARGQAGQAIGLLTRYLPEQPALRGHTYALAGYAEIFLAELFCSGIPLSTLDFDGDFTPKPGSTTAEVLTHAVALFDTALTLVGDNVAFQHLAAVGKGRALLGRGEYEAAAAAVAAVPATYRYALSYSAAPGAGALNFTNVDPSQPWVYSVADREGGNGLDYVTSGDPRTPVRPPQTNGAGFTVYHPAAHALDGSSALVVASGVEARLIMAEAAWHANPADGAWLATLNALRTDGAFDVIAMTPPDTLWHAGSGGVAGLRPLADPGTAAEQVDLLFRERAFWLFLTGHRQGDMRRLIRQYGRTSDEVYPIGPYPVTPYEYGGDVTFPVPPLERVVNSLFTGCITRDA